MTISSIIRQNAYCLLFLDFLTFKLSWRYFPLPPCKKVVTFSLFILHFAVLAHSISPGFAQSPNPPAQVPQNNFDKDMSMSVISTALTFLEPRTIDEHTISKFSLWGLNGLNAIDPSFSVKVNKDQDKNANTIQLLQTQNVIFSTLKPSDNDIKSWTSVIVDMWAAAWNHSVALRNATNQGIIQNFFDELFDHMDPYSRYIGPSSANHDRTIREGGKADIGISLVKQGKFIVINSINTNGPAWAAGIVIGQHLSKVDGKTTQGQSIETVRDWLKGDEGSTVKLSLITPKTRKVTTLSLTRISVPPETVTAFTSGNILILKIAFFSSNTAEEISQYIDQAMYDLKLSGLILDVRGNRGGVLQQAITSVALLLDQGVAATTYGRDPQANHTWAVQGGDLTKGLPIIILVDGRTASAAEILAAALADHKRAVVVGSSTLGKGLVQTIAQLPDGGELFVTWSRVMAPLNWPLQGLGVMPQICTSMGQSNLQKQLLELKNNQSSYAISVANARRARYPLSSKDILNIRNACPAALGTDIDIRIAHDILKNPDIYKAALSLIPDE